MDGTPSRAVLATGVVHAVRAFVNSPECRVCHQQDGPIIALLDLDVAVNQHRTGITAFGSLSLLLGALYFVAVVGIALPTLGYIVVRPMRRLIRALKRVEAGDLTTEVATTGTPEVDAVVEGSTEWWPACDRDAPPSKRRIASRWSAPSSSLPLANSPPDWRTSFVTHFRASGRCSKSSPRTRVLRSHGRSCATPRVSSIGWIRSCGTCC